PSARWGGSPAARRAGRVSRPPPPAIASIAPARRATPISSSSSRALGSMRASASGAPDPGLLAVGEIDPHLSPFDREPPLDRPPQRHRVDAVLDREDPPLEGVGVVVWQHRHGALGDDRPLVHAELDEVHGGPADPHALLEGLG